MNEKQRKFADEYLIDFNATQAAKRVGYSEKTAYSQGQRLLKHVEVKNYIDEKKANISETLNLSRLQIFHELKEIAFDKKEHATIRIKALIELEERLFKSEKENVLERTTIELEDGTSFDI